MSNAALNWAFPLAIIGPKKAVLIALAEHADEHGGCWPSVGRLVLFSGFCERTVRTSLRDLEAVGLLRVDRTSGRTSNRYWLVLNAASPAPLEVSKPKANGAGDAANGASPAPEPLEPSKNPQGTRKSTRRAPDQFPDAVAIWNRVCGSRLTVVTKTTDTRRKAFAARLRDDFRNDMAQWEALCVAVVASDFLCGSSGRFQATFDWVLKPANLAKILEGNYANRTAKKADRMSISEVVRGYNARASPEEIPAYVLDIPPGDWHEH